MFPGDVIVKQGKDNSCQDDLLLTPFLDLRFLAETGHGWNLNAMSPAMPGAMPAVGPREWVPN